MPDLAADSVSQPVVPFADVAELYELCQCRKEQTMRVCRSHETLRGESAAWEEIAKQHLRNEQFYRRLLEQVASHLGPEVFVSDDGSVQDSPLMLKIPELVISQQRERGELLSRVIEAHALIISRGESTDVPLQFSQHWWLNSVSARYWDSTTDNWRTMG